MKVILLEDVKKVGKKGDLVEATDSYARNVLLRQKLAVEANGKTMNDLKLRKANDEKVAEENLEKAKETKALLEKSSVTVRAKTVRIDLRQGDRRRSEGAARYRSGPQEDRPGYTYQEHRHYGSDGEAASAGEGSPYCQG